MLCAPNAGQIELGLMVWERGYEMTSERRHSVSGGVEVGPLFTEQGPTVSVCSVQKV